MSPVFSQRYLVTVTDYDVYDIIVEAVSRAAAIRKAKRIYRCDGFGNTDAFHHVTSYVGFWQAEPLVGEVRS